MIYLIFFFAANIFSAPVPKGATPSTKKTCYCRIYFVDHVAEEGYSSGTVFEGNFDFYLPLEKNSCSTVSKDNLKRLYVAESHKRNDSSSDKFEDFLDKTDKIGEFYCYDVEKNTDEKDGEIKKTEKK